jgi:signal transduction histidine kinase
LFFLRRGYNLPGFSGLLAAADPALLRLVYVNLVGNAIKYTGTSQAARIEIGCLKNPGEVVYFVRDNGVGFGNIIRV